MIIMIVIWMLDINSDYLLIVIIYNYLLSIHSDAQKKHYLLIVTIYNS